MPAPLRIAMWSGPRNISTAMMRAWESRADTAVVDEPFYAFYLSRTRKAHPGAAEIIEAGETDWRKIVKALCNDRPDEKPIIYQKQMTHHLLPEIDRDWLTRLTNCFLVRDPAEVIVSYRKKNDEPDLADLGFVQQAEIFEFVREQTGRIPPVIDARDVLQNPERVLRMLCDAIGASFDPAMLSWPPGLRATDGVWAKHWYSEVARSTSFQPYRPAGATVPDDLREIHDRCREIYEQLGQYRLR
ncbi:MAG TPA: hypothetical protein VGG02_12060 [Chthoniobacterales bacterium]|jgi:hypothetical protein